MKNPVRYVIPSEAQKGQARNPSVKFDVKKRLCKIRGSQYRMSNKE